MTLFLAFDTSERNASVAIFKGIDCLAKIDAADWNRQQDESVAQAKKGGASTTIVSLIKHVMEHISLNPQRLSAIAFSNGPGTFTGVRVGIVTARMLCYAWNKPMVVVNSLDVSAQKLARQLQIEPRSTVWSVVNAQRGEVFGAKFKMNDKFGAEPCETMSLYSRDQFIDELEAGDFVTGSGARLLGSDISQKTQREIPEEQFACCDASSVALTALERIRQNSFDELHSVKPIYFRPSAAEEVRIANASKSG